MKFTLEIDCGNAAFQPVHDDASEPERYEAAADAVAETLKAWLARDPFLAADVSRSGSLRDANGNRCGSWSLSDDAEG
jgi:hypothetical protein